MLFVVLLVLFFAFLVYFLGFAGKKKSQGDDLGEHHRGTSGTTTYNNPAA